MIGLLCENHPQWGMDTSLQIGKMQGCFPAARVSLLALSTAVAIQNAAHRRENAVQANAEELRAVAHLFLPTLVAGCDLLGE